MDRVLTQVEELAENQVRLSVEVPEAEMKHAVEHAASDLAETVKIPGFRKGKVPRQVLMARLGRERVMSEAVDSHIGGWFRDALVSSRLMPVTRPEYDYELPASENGTFTFTATFAVQPKPEPADWTQLEVGAVEPEVPEDVVDEEIESLQFAVAPLEPVDGRPAKAEDVLVIDLIGESEAQRDYVVELGVGRLVEELEEALVGMTAGASREVEYELAEDRRAKVTLLVKEIHERVLPPADDELARAASEFETFAELRADIERTLFEQIQAELETQFRADAADALVAATRVEAAGPVVDARARELLGALERSLERRGISLETYLSISDEDPQAFVERIRDQAAQAVSRELVLEAVADKLGLEVSDEEVRALIREQAAAAGVEDVDAETERILAGPAREQLRDDLRLRAALDRVASEVKRIPADLARAREKLWTPGQEKGPAASKLWTPATTKEPA